MTMISARSPDGAKRNPGTPARPRDAVRIWTEVPVRKAVPCLTGVPGLRFAPSGLRAQV
jgi:hypothetical protein